MPYIELDHQLQARKLENINDTELLPEFERKNKNGKSNFLVNRYNIQKKPVKSLVVPILKHIECLEDQNGCESSIGNQNISNFEPVLGTDREVNYDQDWGLMSAILACYNNHWILITSPEHWWSVVNLRIAAAIDAHGDCDKVRNLIVNHQGKKNLNIEVGFTLSNIDYSWLFNQFSSEIKRNINIPNYVEFMEANFSTTTQEQRIISQITLMASLKKYFSFGFSTSCGIPGLEMKGTEKDWEMLINKFNRLEDTLKPIMQILKLESWFTSTKITFDKLLDTYKGKPDTKWWSHILCWNEKNGSGTRNHWSGWFTEFLGENKCPEHPNDFPSGLVCVPISIKDRYNHPPVSDDGLLVAGTLGFTVSTTQNDQHPRVEPNNTWHLLLPKNSPITPRLKPSH